MESKFNNRSQCLKVLALNIKILAALRLRALLGQLNNNDTHGSVSLCLVYLLLFDMHIHAHACMCRHKNMHTCVCPQRHTHRHIHNFQTSYSYLESGLYRSVVSSRKIVPWPTSMVSHPLLTKNWSFLS